MTEVISVTAAQVGERSEYGVVLPGLVTPNIAELARAAAVPGNGYGQSLRELVTTFRRWVYLPDPGPLYVAISAIVANYAPGDPVWAMIVGPPGGGKTELLRASSTLPHVHQAATLTEGSLLSGTSKKDCASNAKGGLLREIGDFGILLLKDFGSILSLSKDSRGPVLQALREVYDGSWVRHVGTDGGRSLHWEGRVGVIAGATPAIDAHHAVMSVLGERFCYYRLPALDETKHAEGALAHCGQEDAMRHELTTAVRNFYNGLTIQTEYPTLPVAERDWLIKLSRLTCRCRAPVMRDPFSREVDAVPGPEAPTRFTLVLAKMLGGLATIGVDRGESYDILRKIAFDSMPALRLSVISDLAPADKWLRTTEIAAAVKTPTQTTRRSLEDLACYDIVDREPGSEGKADLWKLSKLGRDLWEGAGTFPDIREGAGSR